MTADGELSQDAAPSALPPPHRFIGRGADGLRATRDAMAQVCELGYAGAPEDFRFSGTSLPVLPGELLVAQVPHLRYARSARHVAAGGDAYLVVAYLRGESRVRIAGREIAIAGANVGVIDEACPIDSEVVPPRDGGDAHHITLVVPRAQLAPLLAAPDAVGAQLIRGDTGYGRILHGLLVELGQQAEHLDAAQGARVGDAIAGLVSGAIRPAPGRERDAIRAGFAATRAAIQRYLARQTDPANAIDVAALCRRFAMSRASLYRLFEADGGLVEYVRQLRLQRALQLLSSPAHAHRRIIDIAMEHGFHTESGFIRAFRRRFGVTPSDVRAGAPAARRRAR